MPTDSPVWSRELLYWTWVLAVTGISWLLSPSQVTNCFLSAASARAQGWEELVLGGAA